MYKIVLLRHGESTWNKENRFTGWTDVGLTDAGAEEARRAGELLRAEGYVFDIAFTSVLKRAIKTIKQELEWWEPKLIAELKRLTEAGFNLWGEKKWV